ncbi:MAG: hypothetical protein JWQ40_3016 [Segetibacter sp.]|jgi:hypothetical protein|nr:hypothetical protein [Segetibacter sp.]
MKNVLIFACLAGIAAAVAIYFVSESKLGLDEDNEDFLTDVDYEAYDLAENTGRPQSI